MAGGRIFKKLLSGIMLSLALAGSASADLIETTDFLNLNSHTSPAGVFTINPFDTTLGTLNSVTMGAVLHVDGAAQLWTWGEFSTITYNATNTLDAVTEMGWAPTVAILAGSQTHENRNYDYDESFAGMWGPLLGTPASAGDTTITSNFGRFVGATPFDLGLTLAGSASSTYQTTQPTDFSGNPIFDYFGNPALDTVIFGYDGTAQLYYAYDYTPGAPVPEPSTFILLGAGLGGFALYRRRMQKQA